MPDSPSTHQDSPKVPEKRWPLTLIRRGAKIPDDGSRWWQELPDDQSADGVLSVGYETVEVIPVSALLSDEVVERLARLLAERDGWDWDHDGTSVTRADIASHARIYLEKLTEQVGGTE